MNQKMKYLVVVIISLFLGFFLYKHVGKFMFPSNSAPKVSSDIQKVIFRDTILSLKQPEPIVITKVKTKIKYLTDSSITTKPFSATIDTIIRQDTIHSSFDFPSNNFSLEIRRKPDTLLNERTIVLPLPSEKEVWWTKPVCVAGGVFLGVIIKSILK